MFSKCDLDSTVIWVYNCDMTIFRITAYLEAISFLVLLGIAMPLKYVYGQPYAVKWVGMAHGVLFIAYVMLLAWVASRYEWPLRKSGLAFLASILPFGTIYFDRHCLQGGQPLERS